MTANVPAVQLYTHMHVKQMLQQHILMEVQQSTAHNTSQTHKALHQHYYTHKETSGYTNTPNGTLLLPTLTFLCHRTVTTAEHKFHSCLHCSNTRGHTNPYLYVRTLAALMVHTYVKTPTLSLLDHSLGFVSFGGFFFIADFFS